MLQSGDPPQRKRGRPVKHPLPPPIPDPLENLLKAPGTSPPSQLGDWAVLRKAAKQASGVKTARLVEVKVVQWNVVSNKAGGSTEPLPLGSPAFGCRRSLHDPETAVKRRTDTSENRSNRGCAKKGGNNSRNLRSIHR